MPNYNDLASQQMPSLADLVARMRAKKAQERAANPGARPEDRAGRQQSVQIEGEAPVQAQPVAPQAGGVNVGVGPVTRSATLPPMQFQVSGQPPQQAAGPDPRAAALKQLMSQGLSFEQAMRRIQAGG